MSKAFLTDINLSNNALLNAKIQAWGSTPTGTTNPTGSGTAVAGQISYYSGTFYVFTGSAWTALATGASSFTLGSTSISLGSTTTTVAGLTLSSPTFSGTVTTPLSTAGYVTTTSGGVLGSVATIPNAGLTNSTISGISLGSNLNTLTISSPLSGTSYNGSSAVSIGLATGYGDSQNPYASKTANYVLAAPNGSAGTPSFRALVATDIPSLGNITNAGAIGSTSGLVVSTTTSGALTASAALPSGTTATTQSSGDNSTKVATTAYVDTAVTNSAAGFNVHSGVSVATTANLTGTYAAGSAGADGGTGVGATFTFTATGVTVIDTYTLALGDRVLVKNQTTQTQNGVYSVTTAGTTGVSTVLTRATDFDNSIQGEVFQGDLLFVGSGSQGGTSWVMNALGTSTTPHDGIKIGTDNITFVQFGAGTSYSAGTGLSLSSTTFSINTAITADLTSAQTLTNKTLTSPVISSVTSTAANFTLGIPSVSSSNGYAININGGANSSTTGTGGSINLTAGTASAATGSTTGGSLSINGGSVNSASGTGGQVQIDGGSGNGAPAAVVIQGNTGGLTTIGGATTIAGALTLSGLSSGAGTRFLKVSNLGVVTYDTTTYAKKTTGTGTGTGTAISVNHGLGQWVTNQLFDSSGNQVEVDVQNTATSGGTTIFTFATSQTLSNYTYVIIG